MTTYRGLDGFLSLGGVVTGSPVLATSIVTGASEIEIQSASTLTGIVATGDVFTVSDGASQTVTGSFYDATGNAFATIPLNTTIATAAATGATVAFTANSIGEVTLHELTAQVQLLESSVMGDSWQTFHATSSLMASWSGRGECYLDYDDSKQANLIDDIATATPTGSTRATVFAAGAGKLFYGLIMMSDFSITDDNGSLVTVSFNFTGSGSIRARWD
jgi:hypothetical protein